MLEIQEVETKALSFPDKASAITIDNSEAFIAAGEFLKSVKAMRAEIAATFTPIREKAHAAWKETIRQQEKVEEPLIRAEGILKPRIAAYLTEQERIRREEELRLQKLAQEEEERRQLENAAILDDLGETEEANALLEETPVAAPVVVERNVPKVSGIAMTKRYSAECFDLMALVKAVAAGKAPIQCLKADEVFLNRQAVAMREALQYPGVKVVTNSNISAGRR